MFLNASYWMTSLASETISCHNVRRRENIFRFDPVIFKTIFFCAVRSASALSISLPGRLEVTWSTVGRNYGCAFKQLISPIIWVSTIFILLFMYVTWISGWCQDEIAVLARSLKSSILSSTSFQLDETFWQMMSAAEEQSRRKANMEAQGTRNSNLQC